MASCIVELPHVDGVEMLVWSSRLLQCSHRILTDCMLRIMAQVTSIYENPWTRSRGTGENTVLLLLIFISFLLSHLPDQHQICIRRMLILVT